MPQRRGSKPRSKATCPNSKKADDQVIKRFKGFLYEPWCDPRSPVPNLTALESVDGQQPLVTYFKLKKYRMGQFLDQFLRIYRPKKAAQNRRRSPRLTPPYSDIILDQVDMETRKPPEQWYELYSWQSWRTNTSTLTSALRREAKQEAQKEINAAVAEGRRPEKWATRPPLFNIRESTSYGNVEATIVEIRDFIWSEKGAGDPKVDKYMTPEEYLRIWQNLETKMGPIEQCTPTKVAEWFWWVLNGFWIGRSGSEQEVESETFLFVYYVHFDFLFVDI